ncbi:CNP1-like family protein [Thiogranum longum]
MIARLTFLSMCCIAAVIGVRSANAVDEEDLYGEEALPEYQELPGTEWKEQDIVLPPFPAAKDLIEVDVALTNFPYTLFIDRKSLSVGQDRVIRYTAVLRSAAGAENVVFEGVRCNQRQVQTYAFGSGDEFRPNQNARWRYVQSSEQDRYRDALLKDFFCPLPSGDAERQILRKLKRPNPRGSSSFYE